MNQALVVLLRFDEASIITQKNRDGYSAERGQLTQLISWIKLFHFKFIRTTLFVVSALVSTLFVGALFFNFRPRVLLASIGASFAILLSLRIVKVERQGPRGCTRCSGSGDFAKYTPSVSKWHSSQHRNKSWCHQ